MGDIDSEGIAMTRKDVIMDQSGKIDPDSLIHISGDVSLVIFS